MANLTQTQIRSLVRSYVNEDDFAELKDAFMNQLINHSIRKVQQDLINLGMKVFIKQTSLTGSVVACPSDLLNLPNAIIDIKASTGERGGGTISTSGTGGTITITPIEPGTTLWTINWSTGSTLTLDIDPYAQTIGVQYISATSTNVQLVAALNANAIYRAYFLEATSNASNVLNPASQSSTIAAGTGTGWYPAIEVSIERWNRDSTNTYLAPTATNIIYKRNGDYNGAQILEFRPNTVTYSYIYYYYRLADLTSDSDVSPIPSEYEELLIIDVCIKCYHRLKQLEGVQEKTMEYDRKMSALINDYAELLKGRTIDKLRIKSETVKE